MAWSSLACHHCGAVGQLAPPSEPWPRDGVAPAGSGGQEEYSGVALDRAGITICCEISFLAAGPVKSISACHQVVSLAFVSCDESTNDPYLRHGHAIDEPGHRRCLNFSGETMLIGPQAPKTEV